MSTLLTPAVSTNAIGVDEMPAVMDRRRWATAAQALEHGGYRRIGGATRQIAGDVAAPQPAVRFTSWTLTRAFGERDSTFRSFALPSGRLRIPV